MAANKNEIDTAVVVNSLQTKFELVREAIRTRVQSGMQTHVAQDTVMSILRLLDDCEAEVKVLGLASKEK